MWASLSRYVPALSLLLLACELACPSMIPPFGAACARRMPFGGLSHAHVIACLFWGSRSAERAPRGCLPISGDVVARELYLAVA